MIEGIPARRLTMGLAILYIIRGQNLAMNTAIKIPIGETMAVQMGYAADLHREALIATGVVLFVFILIINLLLAFIKRRKD